MIKNPTEEPCINCNVLLKPPNQNIFAKVVCPRCDAENYLNRYVGHYCIKQLYAQGGMSLVYVADDMVLGREVAIKVIKPNRETKEQQIERFKQESEMTAQINHPNVVQVFGVGEAYDHPFMALELVRGETLEKKFKSTGKLSDQQALDLLIDLVSGLKAAADEGFLHRDVKPANILISESGVPKLIDFGLALEKEESLETDKEIWATPQYVAPETINGEPEDIRSDMYALGATFYHMLSGEVPGKGHKDANLQQLVSIKQNIPPLERKAKHLRRDLCSVINKCMAFYAEHRFSSYEDLANTLRVIRSSKRKEDRGKTTLIYSTKKFARSKKSWSLGFAGLFVISALVLYLLKPGKGKISEPRFIEVQSSSENEPRTNRLLALKTQKLWDEAHAKIASKDYTSAANLLTEIRDDQNVLEPTASWAGFSVAIAYWINGNDAAAEQSLYHLREHISKRSARGLDVPKILPLLNQLAGAEQLPLAENIPATSEEFLAELGLGLKAWDEGAFEYAVQYFLRLQKFEINDQSAWLKPYQLLAGDYILDANLLEKAKPPTIWTAQDAKAALERYEKMENDIKTQGQFRRLFNEWKFRAKRTSNGQ